MSKKRSAQTTLFGFLTKKSSTKNGTNTASIQEEEPLHTGKSCLLYTSDAADE